MSYHCVLFFSSFFPYFFAVFCVVRAKKIERRTSALRRSCVALPLGRRKSSDPMASASAPAGELAVQRPAPASSLAVPSPAASTAEAVDLSAGAAVLEDPGPAAAAAAAASTRAGFLPDSRCLLIFIYITVGSAAAAAVQ